MTLCATLGIGVTDEMTVDQLKSLLAGYKKDDSDESRSSAKNQSSIVRGFNFTVSKDPLHPCFVLLALANKEYCILDRKSVESMRFARELVGATVEYEVIERVTTEKRSYNRVAIRCIS